MGPSSWQMRSPKNFLEVVKEQLENQRPHISFFNKKPKNYVKGTKKVPMHAQ